MDNVNFTRRKSFLCLAIFIAAQVLVWGFTSEAGEKSARSEEQKSGAIGEVKFVAHRVGQVRSEACGVGDFNNDGKFDIIAGSHWYEAPDWKGHKFRTLRGKVDDTGKGYYDDFMNLPLDVDGDGWLDVVTCSWFAEQIDWYKNTGAKGGEWPMTVVDKCGHHECGDLVDIDGDGKELEILTHTRETHWYEIGVTKEGGRGFIKHMVTQDHRRWGGGVGDINGDGRNDILRPDSWYEAPADLRKGRWIEHPLAVGSLDDWSKEELNTLRGLLTDGDKSDVDLLIVPEKSEHTPQILVYDVNEDGLNDIITSSAHRYGIFWYEQINKEGRMSWKKHLIDKSWSQAHSLTLADIDNDGDMDLVTGKRYFAHNGHDPGANDPPVVYWYELKRQGKVEWIKHVVSCNEGIGSGMNIPVVDMDGDGDLDIVVTGKWGGPVYFENKLLSTR